MHDGQRHDMIIAIKLPAYRMEREKHIHIQYRHEDAYDGWGRI